MADESERTQDDGNDSGASHEDNAGLRNMLSRYNNDAMALAAELYNQTYSLREQRRSLRKEIEALRESQPAEGSVVLSKEQAKLWETYQGLGTPQEVEDRLTSARSEARKALLTRAAAAHGLNEKVLTKLLKDSEIQVQQKDGEETETFLIGEGDTAKPLKDVIESDLKEFAPALVGSKQSGQRAVGQAGARDTGKVDYVNDYLSRVQPSPGKEAS